MIQWIWENQDWPQFTWRSDEILALLSEARLIQGKMLGIMQSFNEKSRERQNLQALMDEMITTSAIEGSIIDRDSVRSSIYHRLGIENAGLNGKPDRYVEGLLDILLDATENNAEVLDVNRLCRWHAGLFPTGYSGIHKILVAQLRGEGEMKIVSGRGNKIKLHYIAPPRKILKTELGRFLKWFNTSSLKNTDGIVRAAIAHLWFEKLHPFDDGNGRLGRAIIDLALAQDEKLSTRFYSLSSAIMQKRKGYYEILDKVSAGSMDVTEWVKWFLQCFISAIEKTLENVSLTLKRTQFWDIHEKTSLNERQKKVLNKMLDPGVEGFIGGMTTRKYQGITKISRATAYRELNDLVEKNCLKPLQEKGRSSAYELIWPGIS